MLLWGCRPSEAAYLVCRKSFMKGSAFRGDFDADLAAVCPSDYTKTRSFYRWPVPEKMKWAVELLRELHEQVPGFQEQLGDPKDKFREAIKNFYKRCVLSEAAAESE